MHGVPETASAFDVRGTYGMWNLPVGDECGTSWTYPPFSATIHNGEMYGRGAVDMKGGIACFAAAVARYLEKNGELKGSISFLDNRG